MLLVVEVVILVSLSAIFSGLNIGLVSLSLSEIKRKANLGDHMAIRVLPLRENLHLSLASIILSNIAIISATSILMEGRFNGVIAGIISTLLIVVFGEIFPQALFTRFALKFCYFFTPLLILNIFLTYPITKPLQVLLDMLISNKKAPVPSRGELGMIISEHISDENSELDENEAEILQSVLMLSKKRVSNITTPLSETFYLTEDTVLDRKIIDDIKKNNFSRIPIFNLDKSKCAGILLMKDLVLIDFDTRSYTLDELSLHRCAHVGSRTALDTMFRMFITARTHMMVVTRDEYIIGVVTIEDLIEEILGHEIEDESDE